MGDILAVLASVCWAVYTILMRKISGLGHPTIGCTRRIFFYGLVFMLPVLLLSGLHPGFNRFAKAVDLLNILFLGLCASALCFVTWNWSVRILGAVRTSAYIYVVPVITVAAAYLILHENITGTAVLGAFLTLSGLFLSERKHKERTNWKERISHEEKEKT